MPSAQSQQSEQEPWRCPRCHRQVESQSALGTHLLERHPGFPSSAMALILMPAQEFWRKVAELDKDTQA